MNHLPKRTLRDLATVLVITTELAWKGSKKVLRRLKPLVEPPEDLEVRSLLGAEYTGLVVIENNEVLGGIVVRTGVSPSGSGSSSRYERRTPLFTPPSRERERDPYLSGWSEGNRSGPGLSV